MVVGQLQSDQVRDPLVVEQCRGSQGLHLEWQASCQMCVACVDVCVIVVDEVNKLFLIVVPCFSS
jgi:hypothetical protein